MAPGKLQTDTFLHFESPRLLMVFNTESPIMMTLLLFFNIIIMLDQIEVINNIMNPLLKTIIMVINDFLNTRITIEVFTNELII